MTPDSFDKPKGTNVSPSLGRRTISGILQDIGTRLTEIVRSEVQLARAEVRQDVTQVAKASFFLVMSAIFGLYALGLVILASVFAMGQTLPLWAAALIVGGGTAMLASVFFVIGRKKLKLASLRPDKTIQSLQENVTWLKQQTK